MRKQVIAGITALSLAAAGGVGLALAQPAPPPPAAVDGGPGAMPPHAERGPEMHGAMRGEMRGRFGPHQAMRRAMRQWGLIYTPADRQLSAADVQTIAQGFLLWHGNHTWKVVDVKEQDADTVGFAFATPNGDVIARFTMDRHTGRPRRVG